MYENFALIQKILKIDDGGSLFSGTTVVWQWQFLFYVNISYKFAFGPNSLALIVHEISTKNTKIDDGSCRFLATTIACMITFCSVKFLRILVLDRTFYLLKFSRWKNVKFFKFKMTAHGSQVRLSYNFRLWFFIKLCLWILNSSSFSSRDKETSKIKIQNGGSRSPATTIASMTTFLHHNIS